MDETQWQAWRRVLGSVLSPHGLDRVETVMSLEREVLLRDEKVFLGSWWGGFIHGENRYYVALFGEPMDGRAWGLRFDGHHVSLNWTVSPDGRISTSPVFLGSEPREVPEGWERAGLRALAEEEDAARGLWETLSPAQRSEAELPFAEGSARGSRPLFVGEGPRFEPGAPAGVAHAAMTTTQQQALAVLVETYLSHLAEPLREARWGALDAAGRDALHFAWAGSFTPGEPLYYRVQGPTLLIEFDDTVPEADHVHTVVRDPAGDFGHDLLAEHYAAGGHGPR